MNKNFIANTGNSIPTNTLSFQDDIILRNIFYFINFQVVGRQWILSFDILTYNDPMVAWSEMSQNLGTGPFQGCPFVLPDGPWYELGSS